MFKKLGLYIKKVLSLKCQAIKLTKKNQQDGLQKIY